MQQGDLIPHLFRTEFRKITAVLCKFMGITYMQVAEDIGAETFLSALETWPFKGIPANPEAWLYTVAKNKAKNYISRNNIYTGKIMPVIAGESVLIEEPEIDLSERNITDSQLQLLFALCHPAIPEEAQVGLALRILCGFGIDEIATAFLSNKETISKRLTRAKEKLRIEKVRIEFPGEKEIGQRLQPVLTTLYLLFSEGYYSESNDKVLREDLCLEAMRLTKMLLENNNTNLPEVNALMALMCFHASRFKARINDRGGMILYDDQDTSLWNDDLINKGVYYFHQASQGDTLSKYHLEAGIAYWHTIKTDTPEKWEAILQLYNRLLQINYSPLAALNRTYAIYKTTDKKTAIAEAEKLQLNNNQFYFTLLGELYKGFDNIKAKSNLEKALALVKTNADRQMIQAKIDELA